MVVPKLDYWAISRGGPPALIELFRVQVRVYFTTTALSIE
jgi:hypothetical protein